MQSRNKPTPIGTPYPNQNELICNNAKIQAQNIKTTTQTQCIVKSYINTSKLGKHKHIMFWNLLISFTSIFQQR
jgi:hypothetical protein